VARNLEALLAVATPTRPLHFSGVSSPCSFQPIGLVCSSLRTRAEAPKQGYEGAPDAWLEFDPAVRDGLDGIKPGDDLIVITWLDRGRRDVLRVHPRDNPLNPIAGVFSTRSPDRPNPVGLHRVTVREVDGLRIKVGPLEALDGTPIIDLKPILPQSADC
jgi:tRNA-Thr(GGU) m(6)t(6)A37 methyltransferase TsaA